MGRLYGALCVVGAALPLYFLVSFVADEGIDPRAFWDQATATDLALMACPPGGSSSWRRSS